MAQFERYVVIGKIRKSGFIPVFSQLEISVSKKAVDCCYQNGIRIFEFTNCGDFAHETFVEPE